MADTAKRDADARAAIVADLEKRLRPVCLQWPDDLFDSMVQRLADITLRYEDRVTEGSYDRRTTERLVRELKAALERSEQRRDSHDSDVVAPEASDSS
jgi:hypothetical protein